MSKVYGYCRTATAEGRIDEQWEEIKDYCRKNGMELDRIFCDEGMSAHRTDKYSLINLMNMLQDGDVVIIKDQSRIARDPKQYQQTVDKIIDTGAEVIFINQPRQDELSIKAWLESKMK